VSQAKEITTLGRGGSDTSAVALSCYMKAARCEIFTDVDGVYTADPRIVENPRLLHHISYPLMLALAYGGSRVMHPRAVEFAWKYNIPVEVKSSFTFAPGTLIHKFEPEKGRNMEERNITAIAHKESLLSYVLATDGDLLKLLGSWNNEIFKYFVEEGRCELLIEEKYDGEIRHRLQQVGIKPLAQEPGIGYVTLVGLGINLDPAFLARTLEVCAPFKIRRVQHSEQTIEVMLPSAEVADCVKALHTAFFGGGK
jgi:aspartate kinase